MIMTLRLPSASSGFMPVRTRGRLVSVTLFRVGSNVGGLSVELQNLFGNDVFFSATGYQSSSDARMDLAYA
jgi:hypothetical protein